MLPCYRKRIYSWLSVYSLALEELLLCKNYLRNGSSKAKQQKHPWTKNALKSRYLKDYQNLSKQLVHQKPATPTGPTDDFSQKSLTLTLTSEMLSEVDLSGRAEGWVVETGKTGKTHCWWQVQNLPWVLDSVLLKCLRSHTSLHMYSRWIRTASHRRQSNFGDLVNNISIHLFYFHGYVHIYIYIDIYIFIYFNIYSTFLHQQNWSNTSRRKSVTVFCFGMFIFYQTKNWKINVFPGVVVSNMFLLFTPNIYLVKMNPLFDLRIFFKGFSPSFWRRRAITVFFLRRSRISASTDPPTKFWVSGLGHVDSLHLELLYWRLRVHWPRRKGGAQVTEWCHGVGKQVMWNN